MPFREHRDSGGLKPVSEMMDINTSTENFRAILQLHFMGNSELATHLKSPSNACIEFSLVKFCAIPEIHSTFDFIVDIASFFKSSSKRNARLTIAVKSMRNRISNKWRLQQPCQTR